MPRPWVVGWNDLHCTLSSGAFRSRRTRAMYPRRFARLKPSGLVSRQAKIITDPKAPVIPCTLVDYSPGGACIDLGGQVKLPERFDLLHVSTRKRCRIAW